MTAQTMARRQTKDPDAVLGYLLLGARLNASMTCEQAGRVTGLTAIQIAAAEDGDGSLLFVDAVPLLAAYGVPMRSFAANFEAALRTDDVTQAGVK